MKTPHANVRRGQWGIKNREIEHENANLQKPCSSAKNSSPAIPIFCLTKMPQPQRSKIWCGKRKIEPRELIPLRRRNDERTSSPSCHSRILTWANGAREEWRARLCDSAGEVKVTDHRGCACAGLDVHAPFTARPHRQCYEKLRCRCRGCHDGSLCRLREGDHRRQLVCAHQTWRALRCALLPAVHGSVRKESKFIPSSHRDVRANS
jgi:hypothetical protein